MIQKIEAKRNLSANLKRLLKDRKMEQAELAAKTGEKPLMISRAVRGLHMPAGDVLHRIAEALDVSVDRLLGPLPPMAPAPEFSENPEILQKTG